jgi:hypothetical protein
VGAEEGGRVRAEVYELARHDGAMAILSGTLFRFHPAVVHHTGNVPDWELSITDISHGQLNAPARAVAVYDAFEVFDETPRPSGQLLGSPHATTVRWLLPLFANATHFQFPNMDFFVAWLFWAVDRRAPRHRTNGFSGFQYIRGSEVATAGRMPAHHGSMDRRDMLHCG